MNQRYDMLGERLADRQHELEAMLDNVKVYLQDLHTILTWLEDIEKNTQPFKFPPPKEDEALKKLTDHKVKMT